MSASRCTKWFVLVTAMATCLALPTDRDDLGKGIFDRDPTVTIAQGEVKGKTITSDGVRVDRFLAIPFADPPTGDLRFRPPVAHKGWGSDVYDASIDLSYKLREKTCLQTVVGFGTMGSEDCLYVSVWVSGGIEEAQKNHLPVMVWIHGGAYVAGSGWGANFFDNWLYDQERMVRHGNVIAVTLNYRLGPLGFMSTGDDASPGNYGLLDQLEALKWVKNNIWAFGGDTNKITIYGESAGAASVSFHMISPLSKDYFNRGISQSGTVFSSWAVVTDPLRWAQAVAEGVGCPTNDTNYQLVDCVRQAPVDDVVTAVRTIDLQKEVLVDMPWSAVVDGYFLPDDPAKMISNSADKDYLLGTNNNDGHLFAGAVFPKINMDNKAMDLRDLAKASTIIQYQVPEQVSEAIVFQYKAYSDEVDDTFYKKAIVNLFTDRLFASATHWNAHLRAANEETTGNTFVYLFSHPSKMPLLYPPWMGADHADDLQYVFAKPFQTPLVYTNDERDITNAFMTYWTNFAWSGDPNVGPNDHTIPANWPAYDLETKNYLEINGSLTENGNAAVGSSYREDFTAFWNVLIPQVWDSSLHTCDVTKTVAKAVVKDAASSLCPGDLDFQRDTTKGCVQGTSGTWNGKMYSKFLGIPFATPPLGEKRFQNPTENEAWTGVRSALEFSKICSQSPYDPATMSEDCLYLNVYVPIDTTLPVDYVSANKYAVMVWVHGGSYMTGNVSPDFQGDVFAAQNNVIVVTVNYRLGSLGFLTTGDSNVRGNFGLLDQRLAFLWVRDNIAQFGGDPTRVTLFGQGAGSEAVQMHTVSSLNTDLGFTQAILQSGTALRLGEYPEQVALSQTFADASGCGGSDAATMLSCLRSASLEDLIVAQQSMQFAPVVDRYFLQKDPSNLMGILSPFASWSFIVGTNDGDGTTYWDEVNSVQTEDDFHDSIADEFSTTFGMKTGDIEFEYYMWSDPKFTTNQQELQTQLFNLYTDYRYVAPAGQVADSAVKARSAVYVYQFQRASLQNPYQGNFPMWTGAAHGSEIPYVWGDVARDVTSQGNHPDDTILSYSVMEYWGNFAKTGDPNLNELGNTANTPWPAYTADSKQHLLLDATITPSSYLRGKQVEFWNYLLPTLDISCPVTMM
ncbi:unnamed protein product [Clavelina lepadiformis]|uniref:Carboxylesterase type B domain-containing protein n=1 Tax=Clavelina lepadiformis TaxID=159417 RepID=A0ABP0G172_CLALP